MTKSHNENSCRLALGSGILYGYSLEEVLSKTEEFGYRYAEITGPIHTNDLIYNPKQVDMTRKQLARLGLSVSSIHTYISKGDSRVTSKKDYYKKLSLVAKELGAGIIVDHIAYFGLKSKKEIPDYLKRLTGLFREKDIIYTFENLAESPEECARFLENIPELRFTLDIKHAMYAGHSLKKYLTYVGKKTVNMHLLGYHPLFADMFGDAQAPGADSFSWDEFAALLKRHKYTGQLTVELFPENLSPFFLLLLLLCQDSLRKKTVIGIPRLTYPEWTRKLPKELSSLDMNKIGIVYNPKGLPAAASICDLLAVYTKKFCEKKLLRGLKK